MNHHFKELFRLQGFRLTKTEIIGEKLIVDCRLSSNRVHCKTCGKWIKTIHQYHKPQRIKHMFWQGNIIELAFTKRSFFCWKCKKKGLTWLTLEQAPIIGKKKRYSLAWADQILK